MFRKQAPPFITRWVPAIAALALFLVVMSGCAPEGGSGEGETTTTEEVAESTTTTAKKGDGGAIDCENLTTPDPSESKGAENKVAVMETSKGTIKFEFYPKDAPIHVANFIQLAQCGFYNGIRFHRVGPGPGTPPMAQAGDPTSKDGDLDDPNMGGSGPGYNIPDEFNNRQHIEGTLAMAKTSEPDSAGSQFYIAKAPIPYLDGNYTVFGQAIEGKEVIQKIVKGDTITKITIVPKQ